MDQEQGPTCEIFMSHVKKQKQKKKANLGLIFLKDGLGNYRGPGAFIFHMDTEVGGTYLSWNMKRSLKVPSQEIMNSTAVLP